MQAWPCRKSQLSALRLLGRREERRGKGGVRRRGKRGEVREEKGG